MPIDHYTIVQELIAPGAPGRTNHLVDYETQQTLSELWSEYLGRIRAGLTPSRIHPAMRRVAYSLDGEAMPGQVLWRGIRMATRSRRSCTFDAALWHADGRMIHRAEIITVFVEPGGGAVPIPEDFWSGVEQFEGRPIGAAVGPVVQTEA